jgi:hypothetical protein
MALTMPEEERLIAIFDACEEIELTQWETKFVADLRERYKELGPRLFVSGRMWAILTELEERHPEHDE